MTTRRQFLGAAVAVAATPVAAFLYTWRVEPHWLEIVHRPLPIPGLRPDLVGRTLVQLSDLHIGPLVDDSYIADTFRRVTSLEPDFVVHTGDLLTYRRRAVFDQTARLLERFPHGRLGTVAILGNHDYGPMWTSTTIASHIEQLLTNAGAVVLRNAGTTIAGLGFIGMDDFWGPRFGPPPSLLAAAASAPTIALCHNPDAVDRPVWGNFRGWILSGHTHGGQCKPPFLPPPILPVKNKRYTSGEFELDGGRRLYISRGVGHLMRVRFNVRPEVVVFHLTAGDTEGRGVTATG